MSTQKSLPNELEAIHEALLDLVRAHAEIRKQGHIWVGQCPFPTCRLYKREDGFCVYPHHWSFYCFGCHAHGDVYAFVRRLAGAGFPEPMRALVARLQAVRNRFSLHAVSAEDGGLPCEN